MVPSRIGAEDGDQLVAELKSLRRGAGVSLRKLNDCPNLLAVPAVRREVQRGADPARAALRVIEQSIAALGSRTVGLVSARAALECALATPSSTPGIRGDLSQRRLRTARIHRVHVDTVRRAEEEGIKELAAVLRADEPTLDTLVTPVPEEDPYEAVSVDWAFRYDARGHPLEAVDKRVIRSKSDPLRSFLFSVLLTGDVVIAEIDIVSGGRLEVLDASPTGYRRYRVVFAESVPDGETAEVVMVRRFAVQAQPPMPFLQFVPTRPTSRATLRVEFSPLRRPVRMRRVVSVAAHLPIPAETPQGAHLDSNDAVEAAFENLAPGYAYGLVWDWQDQR